MKYSNWIGLTSVILLIIACTLPWVVISSKSIIVTGLQAAGTNYGKPGLMNVALSTLAGVFFLIPRIGAKRTNLFLCAFNMAWAIRSFIMVSACYGGICPVKQIGLYLLIVASVIMTIAAIFPEMKLKNQ